MRGGDAVSGQDGNELTAHVFRTMHRAYDLHAVEASTSSRGDAVLRGLELGDVARQISDHGQWQARRTQ